LILLNDLAFCRHEAERFVTWEKSRSVSQRSGSQAQITRMPEKSKRFALIIGIDDYQDKRITRLSGAANDARLLATTLVRYAGFPFDQVVLLASDQTVDRQPTRAAILERLSNFVGRLPKEALLVVSFAGHGLERAGQTYLLPADARPNGSIALLNDTGLKVSKLRDMIRAMGIQQVLIFLDACRNDPRANRGTTENRLTAGYAKELDFDLRNRDVQAFAVLFATMVGQSAYEYPEKQQGIFTWTITEGLKGNAANQKGEITLGSLLKYVEETVPEQVKREVGDDRDQRPWHMIEGYRANDLVIAIANQTIPDAGTTLFPSYPTANPFLNGESTENYYWDMAKIGNETMLMTYLQQYPQGRFAEQARKLIIKIAGLTVPSEPVKDETSAKTISMLGVWKLSLRFEKDSQWNTRPLYLEQSGINLYGAVFLEIGGSFKARPVIGVIDGAHVTLDVSFKEHGKKIWFRLEGQTDGKEIRGTMKAGGEEYSDSQGEFYAER
jgi:hypothetical protein